MELQLQKMNADENQSV